MLRAPVLGWIAVAILNIGVVALPGTTALGATVAGAPIPADSSEDAHWSREFDVDGTLSSQVMSLAVFDGRLVAGGRFIWAMTEPRTALYLIASWNGHGWEPFGGGLHYTPNECWFPCQWQVEALLPYEGDLIAGGSFSRAEAPFGVVVNHIARWDGSHWHPLGSGMNDWITCLAEYQGDVIAGGFFTTAGGTPAAHIARWDGNAWYPLGVGFDEVVDQLQVYDGELVASGSFRFSGSLRVNGIAIWDGASWHPMGAGSRTLVTGCAVFDGALLASGEFSDPETREVSYLAQWDGNAWRRYADGCVNSLIPGSNAFVNYRGDLVRGTAGPVGCERWTGTEWRPLGSGVHGEEGFWVLTLLADDTSLYVGGWFTTAGGHPSENIARWDDVITPVRVEDLQVMADEDGIRISWRLSRETLAETRGVAIERADAEPGPYLEGTAQLLEPRSQMTYLDTDILSGRSYWYRLRLERMRGDHEWTVPVFTTAPQRRTTLRVACSPCSEGRLRIDYQIGSWSPRTHLQLFSVQGRLVRTLVHEQQSPGTYSISWDGNDEHGLAMAHGLYIVRLAADRIEARKVAWAPR